MQQRFCSCGCEVMVYYLTRPGRPARFWAINLQFGETIDYCPNCGHRLHIDSLK